MEGLRVTQLLTAGAKGQMPRWAEMPVLARGRLGWDPGERRQATPGGEPCGDLQSCKALAMALSGTGSRSTQELGANSGIAFFSL